ncbi:MAG: DUF4214 domain-containing protein [Pseudomonadota bacterium]
MSFSIEFDYRFDTEGFFTTEARAAMESAAGIWENLIKDDFPTFLAGQPFSILNLATGLREDVILDQDVDDVLIFVNTSNILGGSLAEAGASGFDVGGDINRLRYTSDFRGMGPATDFEPFIGIISFDPSFDWGFAIDAPEPGKYDLITVAIHEIGHVLGIGGSAAFDQFLQNDRFVGPNALAQTSGAGIELETDLAHIAADLESGPHAMERGTSRGERDLPSALDQAILADIGYEIEGFVKQGSPFAFTTESGERVFGSSLSEAIDGLGGDDTISGRNGDDTVHGGAGDDELFGNNQNDQLFGDAGNDTLSGETGDDLVVGGAGTDRLFGGDGRDTLIGGAEDDVLSAGAGDDNLRGQEGVNSIFGGGGTDRFFIGVGDGQSRLNDLDFGTEQIVIDPFFGFTSAEEVLARVTRPASNIVEIVLPGQASAFVFTNQTGTSLSEQNIVFDIMPDPLETNAGILVMGTTADNTLRGGLANDRIAGAEGNDILIGNGGADILRGDAGDDVLIAGATFTDVQSMGSALYFDVSTAYTIQGGTDYAVITSSSGERDKLFGMEFLIFDDQTIQLSSGSALDGAGAPEDFLIAERVALLYEAALNRDGNIDLPGLNFYISVTQRDMLTDEFLAQDLMTSPEFTANFGDANTLSNAAFLEQIYLNVLDRPSDAAGRQFYLDLLNAETISKALALADIAVSPENASESKQVLMGLYETSNGDWAFL